MSGTKPKANRASFGTTRKLPSGRFQARYTEANGQRVTAPTTFETKRAALDYLAGVRADKMRGHYRDHRAGSQVFGTYATDWIANGGSRGRFAPRTRANNEDLLAAVLAPLHDYPLNTITPAIVRTWYSRARKDLADRLRRRAEEARRKVVAAARKRGVEPPEAPPTPTGEARLRQAYALLRSILSTAVADGLIASNPCQIKGAGIASAPERPYMAPVVLSAIVEQMPEHYDLPMRTMFGAHLRLGELVALQRGDFADGVLRVERQVTIVRGVPVITPTKTGETRAVAVPRTLALLIQERLDATVGFPKSPIFTRPDGDPLTRSGIQQAWGKARAAAGHPQFHVHDVRHAGLTLAAQAGATMRELMARAGHRTTAAAMTYQHVAEERTALVAERMDALAGAAFTTTVEASPVAHSREPGVGLKGVLSLEMIVG